MWGTNTSAANYNEGFITLKIASNTTEHWIYLSYKLRYGTKWQMFMVTTANIPTAVSYIILLNITGGQAI